jgi:catechol 2,3-dioxygenase-like lactoylglutathione lyase family enzyme
MEQPDMLQRSPARGPFEAATLAATIVRVRDVAASVNWYRDKLGLEPVHVGSDGPEHPIAAYSIAGAVVSLWQLPSGEERTRDENDRNSYVVAVVDDDLEAVRELLASRGVEVSEVRRTANNEYCWFYDPDGNRFELSRPITAEFQAAATNARL